jgi:GntR family transcriptional regulator
VIDPSADRALFRQIADDLRAQIFDGRLKPGALLRGERALAFDYGVGERTVRAALDLLERETLIVRQAGRRAQVRVQPEREQVRVQRGSTLLVRPPTPKEREELRLEGGVLVVEILYGGRPAMLYAADRTLFTFS